MSFLHRRRSNRSRPSLSPSPSPSPQPSSYGSAIDLSTNGTRSVQPSLRKRFSTLAARLAPTFTPRPKPLSYTRSSAFDRHSSRSSSPTSPDIRPPSGLGRRASSLSLEYADAEAKKAKGTGMPNKTPLSITVEGPRESRLRCTSSPDLLGRMGNPGVRTGPSSPSNPKATIVRTGSEKIRVKRKPLPPLDLELHNELAQQSPRSAQRPPTPNRPPQRPVPTSAPPPPPTPSQDPLPSPGVTPKSPDRPAQSLAPLLRAARPTRARSPPFPIPLGLLLPHLPRSALPTLALISKRFRTAARAALYYSLDLSPSTSDSDDDAEPRWQQQVDACIALLASDASLAGLVHIFVCPVFPFDPPPPTFLLALTLALRNMPHLTSLILPSLPPLLLLTSPSPPFSLQSLTLLQSSITPPAAQSLFTVFLPAQSALHALALPHLDLPPSSPLTDELELSPAALALPKLASLAAPPTLAVALAPGRALRAVALHVASSLYDGLRPAHVMGALARAGGVRRLGIVPEADGAGMDVRTLVKLCLAAGAELGEGIEELRLGWTLDDEVLYRQIPTILPRFRSLRALRLTRPAAVSVDPTPEPASPARSRATPPHLALDLPSSPPLSAFFTPDPESSTFPALPDPPAEPEPDSVPFPSVSPKPVRRPRRGSVDMRSALDAAIDMSEEDRERMHIATWAKAGPALREVVFLSGARWRVRDGGRFERVG